VVALWPFCAGDNIKVAQAVAKAVGIQHFKAGLKPEDKLSYVQQAADQASQEKNGRGEQWLVSLAVTRQTQVQFPLLSLFLQFS
jgi:hypothetical protein